MPRTQSERRSLSCVVRPGCACGDKVTATARKLEDIADLKNRFGEAVLPLALDVTDSEQVPQVVQASKHFGKAGCSGEQCRHESFCGHRRGERRTNPRLVRRELRRDGSSVAGGPASAAETRERAHPRIFEAVLGLRLCPSSASTVPRNGQWKLYTNRCGRR